MFPRRRRPPMLSLFAAVATCTLVAAAGCGGDGTADTSAAGFRLAPLAAQGATSGAAFLSQDGDRLRGHVVVWGLEPGSRHASHLHASPEGETPASCPDAQTDRHVVDFEPLVADEAGVATREVDVVVAERIVRPGVYWMIHENAGHSHGSGGPPPPNPGLLCGDVLPSAAS